MTTVHSTAASQKTVDSRSERDWHGGRCVNNKIIPASTRAAKSVTEVIPSLAGKLIGMAFRVPTIDISLVDLVVRLEKGVSYKEITQALKKAAKSEEYKGIIAITEDQLVSSQAGLQLNNYFVKLVA